VLAIEFLAAAQALDFQKLRPGKGVRAAHTAIRSEIPHLARDRYLARDIAAAAHLLENGEILGLVESEAGHLRAF
ncbi:MAG: histidine ammonia-lyase, partial [Planctomycetota bacterium]|jgi:histidine ammonia-lyase